MVTQKWQHLAVSVSFKVIRFYENGEKVYSQELEGGEANQFSNIIIGKNRHGGAKYDGHIDDVLYNRAINDAEVRGLFDGGLEDSDGDGLTLMPMMISRKCHRYRSSGNLIKLSVTKITALTKPPPKLLKWVVQVTIRKNCIGSREYLDYECLWWITSRKGLDWRNG